MIRDGSDKKKSSGIFYSVYPGINLLILGKNVINTIYQLKLGNLSQKSDSAVFLLAFGVGIFMLSSTPVAFVKMNASKV